MLGRGKLEVVLLCSSAAVGDQTETNQIKPTKPKTHNSNGTIYVSGSRSVLGQVLAAVSNADLIVITATST